MRLAIVGLALTLGLAAGAQAAHQLAQLEDVVLLAREGLSDDTIIAFLETREIGFALDTEEILRLRDAGVSEEVIRYLLARTSSGPAPSPAYAPADVPPVLPSYSYSGYYEPGYDAPYGYGYVGLSLFPHAWFGHHHHGHLRGHRSVGHRSYGQTVGHVGHARPRLTPSHALGHGGHAGHHRGRAHSGRGHGGGRALGHSAGHAGGRHGGSGGGHGGHHGGGHH